MALKNKETESQKQRMEIVKCKNKREEEEKWNEKKCVRNENINHSQNEC